MAAPPPPTQEQPSDELTPRQLADAWKKAGGFDRLRKQLLHDFVHSPEKDALVADLDSLLPTLLSSTPSLARAPRQARVAETASLLDKRGALSGPVLRLENRLQSGKGVGRTVQRELTRVMCDKKGLPFVEDPREDEEEEKQRKEAREEVPPPRPDPGRPEVRPEPAPQTHEAPPEVAHAPVAPSAAPTHAMQPSPAPPPPDTAASTVAPGAARGTPALAAEAATGAVPAGKEDEDVEMVDAAASAAPAEPAPRA